MTAPVPSHVDRSEDLPAQRYTAVLAHQIEASWQDRWEAEGTFNAPNPVGDLDTGFGEMGDRPKLYVLDMFPYPSSEGLHVGHPLGYIATDVYSRYQRMNGRNVVHTMGYDAFGLPAEQFAVQTGTHPRATTETNIATYRRQLRRLGLGYDQRRSVATTDESFYRWTQWIFLQIFNAWYDREADRARPIDDLVAELDAGARQPAPGTNPFGQSWADLDESARRAVVNNHRLVYRAEAMVNWCPGLGTVLANEEVTPDGRSDRGNFPVYRRPMKQWMMRITAYADRLIADLDLLDWPDSIKLMQRNWIGRSTGARITFPVVGAAGVEVFTTRPDTLFGATYLVLAPEHDMVDELTANGWPAGTPSSWTGGHETPAEAVRAYQKATSGRSDLERQTDARAKTGIFVGSYATNPATGALIPVFVADYVLMGYGTGAIMAVPGQDERDWDFAARFELPVVRTVEPPADFAGDAYLGDGPAIHSGFLDGLDVTAAKEQIIGWLSAEGHGEGTVQYRLRDWLFSRQRYWGEPFPIVYGDDDQPRALPEDQLPVVLPELEDFAPVTSDREDSDPEPPLGRAADWAEVTVDLGDGPQRYRRELNTMPQWAGSCWYELRYLDPTNEKAFVDPIIEQYWMGPKGPGDSGGVDLYVGGVEHAVLHLLYARFWHKALFDLGHLSSCEPFHRLYNQGYIQAYAYLDERGMYVDATKVEPAGDGWSFGGRPVTRVSGKMGKSLKNSVTPDEMCERYGADTLRLYEMFTGPLDQSRPWETKQVVGMYRLLQRIWRALIDEDSGAVRVDDAPADDETLRVLHHTIASVREGMESLRFNTSIARITELNNHLTASSTSAVPREVAEPLVLLLAPLAPHMAEELWARMDHEHSLASEPFPAADPARLVQERIEVAVQVNGKLRARIRVPPGLDSPGLEAAARAEPKVAALLTDASVRRVVVVPGRLVNFVVA